MVVYYCTQPRPAGWMLFRCLMHMLWCSRAALMFFALQQLCGKRKGFVIF